MLMLEIWNYEYMDIRATWILGRGYDGWKIKRVKGIYVIKIVIITLNGMKNGEYVIDDNMSFFKYMVDHIKYYALKLTCVDKHIVDNDNVMIVWNWKLLSLFDHCYCLFLWLKKKKEIHGISWWENNSGNETYDQIVGWHTKWSGDWLRCDM